ncbi:AAA family ATPase [Elongatibacter sediminis]|uniref:ATP-binding protein n=1 Tax=Elongatibacter sediminis TaxID=3119006 RepID=A0AAW9REU7_9GAMM
MDLPRLVVLSGLPRSGKSTVAALLAERHGFIRVCSDDLREEYGMVWGTRDSRESVVNHVVHYRAMEGLMMARDVVVDTTGMFRAQRRLFFDLSVYSLGKVYPLNARRLLISLDVDDAVWQQRQRDAGRDLAQLGFYRDRFESVTPQEIREVDEHARYTNNTPDELDRMGKEIDRLLSQPHLRRDPSNENGPAQDR